MNERIKELARQCYETGPLGKDGWPEYTKFNEGKFAELLVRECVDKIKENWTRHCTGSVRPTDYNLGLSRAISSIEEHFGVK